MAAQLKPFSRKTLSTLCRAWLTATSWLCVLAKPDEWSTVVSDQRVDADGSKHAAQLSKHLEMGCFSHGLVVFVIVCQQMPLNASIVKSGTHLTIHGQQVIETPCSWLCSRSSLR